MTDTVVKMDLALAPGCFGMGLIYKADAKECSSCPFASKCGPLATARLEAVRSSLGLKPPAADTPQPFIAKKVQALISNINRANIAVTDLLLNGKNPFLGKSAFLSVTCHLLLKVPQGVTRDLLKQALMTKLSWSAGTADSHVTQSFQVLTALGAAVETNGALQLRR